MFSSRDVGSAVKSLVLEWERKALKPAGLCAERGWLMAAGRVRGVASADGAFGIAEFAGLCATAEGSELVG